MSSEPAFKDLSSLLEPRSIAIVGASPRENGWPARIWANLQQFGYAGKVYPVNPRYERLWGQRCYPGLATLPEVVDNAVISVPAETAVEILQDEKEARFRAATILSGGFGEGGDAKGLIRKEILRSIARERNVRFCGPNCMGLVSTRSRAVLFPELRLAGLAPGGLGLVSQSGGLAGSLVRTLMGRGLGLSYFVTSGNEVDAELSDYLHHFVEDEETRVVAAVIEGVRNAAKFLAVAREALARQKPILALKIGRSAKGSEAALAHTGALAGNDAVFDAVCRDYGVIRAADLDELVNCMELCLRLRVFPTGKRVGFITFSGGLRGFIADLAAAENLELPDLSSQTERKLAGMLGVGTAIGNPLDTGWSGLSSRKTYLCCIDAMLSDSALDMLAVQEELPSSPVRPDKEENLLAVAEVAKMSQKPIAVFSMVTQGVNEYGRNFKARCPLPFIEGAHNAVKALKQLGRFGETIHNGRAEIKSAATDSRPLTPEDRSVLAGKKVLNEWECYPLLRRYGVPVARSALAPDPQTAARAADEIGYPVVVKVCAEALAHKSDLGGVRAGLTSSEEVKRACAEIEQAWVAARRGRLSGFLVQEMVRGGVETIIGAISDPQFGPAVMFGLGGVHAEIYRDTVFRLAPVNAEEAMEMVRAIRSFPLLAGFRGRPPIDGETLSRAIAAFSELAAAGKDSIQSIDVNPFICLERGGFAVDCVIVSQCADIEGS